MRIDKARACLASFSISFLSPFISASALCTLVSRLQERHLRQRMQQQMHAWMQKGPDIQSRQHEVTWTSAGV